ncbi:glycosyltransferase [Paraconexibacter algicola]|uniref:Uncharacterized protein n=1 Tax=Paraconexibacter algicola TaxID=2133960 RepID=A0A2T4UL79_9ACTN|nr:galactosyltransferase-related protein [Paraconexibacter algicola]PTL60006.1 hypothetical protein C7Y72_10280 [Paraconexibacter algicola]
MIAYYAHHHGSGHLRRATALARALDEPVALLSSSRPPRGHPFAEVLTLPLDDGGLGSSAVLPGLAHHAPLDSPGLAGRMAQIATFLAGHVPATLVVDVSVEVALLGRLLGARVLVVRQHGDRDDEAHRHAYRAAARLLAPWPRWLDEGQPDPWASHTTWTGGFSLLAPGARAAAPGDGTVVLLGGRGGGDAIASAARGVAREEPGRPMVVLGPAGGVLPEGVEHRPWEDDPGPVLRRADVIVVAAGHNAVMDAAATGRPLVVVADDRPYGEQRDKARRLHATGAALHVPDPAVADWSGVLRDAVARGPGRAPELLDPEGAVPFARAVVAHRPARRVPAASGRDPVVVCTLVHGRLEHLAAQHESLRRHAPEARHVVAWMGGPDPRPAAPDAEVVEVPGTREGEPLPLAAARNAALAAAPPTGVALLLDVDCTVRPGTVAVLAAAVRRTDGVVLPRVLYEPPDRGAPREHPARSAPAVGDGSPIPCSDWGLAWTVALGVPLTVVREVGGFDERYRGYGAEDTDFAWRCRAVGVPLHWAPAADVVHRHHEGGGVPYDRAAAVVANAVRFQRTWGHWPMVPWLRAFAAAGLLPASLAAAVTGEKDEGQ